MKNPILLIFVFSLILFSELKAQTCCHVPAQKKTSIFTLPKFSDSSLFESALTEKIDLKAVFDQTKKEKTVGYYKYNFFIDKSGQVRPAVYYQEKVDTYNKLQQYIVQTFNHYHWLPGNKKKCQTCKVETYLTLSIYFKNNKVETLIKDVETQSSIFYREIKYSDLKVFIRK